jgi:predicted nucleotide-binding protein
LEKSKRYARTKFDSKTLAAAEQQLHSISSTKIKYLALQVSLGDGLWSFNTFEEFLAAADQGSIYFYATSYESKVGLSVSTSEAESSLVGITAPTRDKIESLVAIFEKEAERCRLPEPEKKARVFIGHGQDPQWRDLKDHLHEKHGYVVEAYEIGSRAGHTIRDILEEMLSGSTVALLVMTGEDETKDGKLLARQNVVHEAGLFQGKLGFSRAIILLEEGTEEFSNIHGLQQIRFSKGRIKESFGDVVSVLKRELG